MLAHPTPDHGAARSEYGGDGWSHQGERDSTQAGPRTHMARRAEGTEVLAIDVAANYRIIRIGANCRLSVEADG